LNDWRFPKISYGFLQDAELKRNYEDEKVEKDFLLTKLKILDRIWGNSQNKERIQYYGYSKQDSRKNQNADNPIFQQTLFWTK